MELKLSKPICFFDLETTGTNVAKDRIVEICRTVESYSEHQVQAADINGIFAQP